MNLSHKRVYIYFDKWDFVWVLTAVTKLNVYLDKGVVVLDERDFEDRPAVCIIEFEDPQDARVFMEKLYKREAVYVKARKFRDSTRFLQKHFDVSTNEDGLVIAVDKQDGWDEKTYKKYVFSECTIVK